MASFRKNGNGIFGTGFDTDGVKVTLAMSNRSRWSRNCFGVADGEGFLKGASEATGGAKEKTSSQAKTVPNQFYPDISISYKHY